MDDPLCHLNARPIYANETVGFILDDGQDAFGAAVSIDGDELTILHYHHRQAKWVHTTRPTERCFAPGSYIEEDADA